MAYIVGYRALECFEQDQKHNAGCRITKADIREDSQHLDSTGAKW
jgi:hypothetical protein